MTPLPSNNFALGMQWSVSMIEKTARILIADQCHEYRLCIEKLLNKLGYFRIISVSSSEEVWRLTQVNTCPIILLIIQENLLQPNSLNTLHPPLCRPSTSYILRYKIEKTKLKLTSWDCALTDSLLDSSILGVFMPLTFTMSK